MKKKKIILSTCLGALLVIACVGIWLGIRNSKQTVGNGNKLGVEWYHENGDEFVITTVEQLYELAKLSKYYDFKGQTIKLGADIVVNEGSTEDWEKTMPENLWSPIYGFAGTFDGQGHTISGVYGMGYFLAALESVYENAPTVETAGTGGCSYLPTGLFAYTQEECVIKNLNMTNSIFFNDVYTGCGSIVGNGAGTLDTVYSDAVIINYRRNAGGLVGLVENGSFNLINCWYDGEIRMIGNDGRWSGGLVGNIVSKMGTTKIKHCLNTADITSEIVRTDVNSGGFVGTVSSGAKLEMEDSLTVGSLTVKRDSGVGTAVGSAVEGSMLMMKNVYTNLDGYPATIGAVGGTYKSFPLELKETCLVGTSALEWTNLDFEKYWTVVEGGTPMLREFADTVVDKTSATKAYDISWYDPSKSEYTISTIDEFYGWYILSANNDFTGKTIKLGADLVVNEGDARKWEKEAPEVVWYPIKHFAGTFDGQGHTISGVYLNTNQPGSGLFTSTGNTAVMKNFKFTNSYLSNRGYNYSYFGGIVGRGEGQFDTIYCDAIISNTAVRSTGGIVGQVIGSDVVRINNCWFNGSVTIVGQIGSQAGGIAGRVERAATLKMTHCLNSGRVTSEREKGILLIGGFVGVSSDSTIEISDSLNVGEVSGPITQDVTSAISWINDNTNLTFENAYATAESCVQAFSTVKNTYTGGCLRIGEKYLTGSKAYQWTLLDFDKYWAIQKNGTPILQSFAEEIPSVAGLKKKMDISWYKMRDKEFKIDSVAKLYGFTYLSYNTDFRNKTVQITKNLEVNAGNAADWATSEPANPWFPVNNFAGTFDGKGHTLKGIYLTDAQTKSGLFAITMDKSVIKNFRLENSYFKHIGDTNGQMGSIAGSLAGELNTVYSNAIIEGERLMYGGLVAAVYNNKAKISNCWYDGQINLGETGGWVGGIVGLLQSNKEVMIEHCLNTGTIGCKNKNVPSVSGLIGIIEGTKTSVKVSDSLNTGKLDCPAESAIGSFLGYMKAKNTLTIKDTYTIAEAHKYYMGPVSGEITGRCYKLESNVITGINGYRFTELDFKNYWSAIENSTPVLKSFAGKGLSTSNVAKMIDKSWYKENKKVFELKDVQDLYGFAMLSQDTDFKGKTIKLSNSIVVNNGAAVGYEIQPPQNIWIPITTFAGVFDGQGHSIQGLYLKTGQQKGGLFSATTVDATVKNLRLENSYFEHVGSQAAALGSVIGQCEGLLDTVYSDAVIKGNSLMYGGIAGYVKQGATIRNCWYSGDMMLGDKGGWAGGIVGEIYNGSKAIIEHCLVTATISTEYKSVPSVAGICGIIEGKGTTVTIVDTLSAGTVIAPTTSGVGSMLGYLNTGSDLTVKDTYVTIESHVNYIGGQKGTLTGAAHKRAMDVLTGSNGYRMTTLDFDKYWVAVDNDTPILKSFTNTGMNLSGIARLIDTSWYDENQTVYELADKEDLYGFAILSTGTDFKGKTVKLKNDIVVNEGDAENWSQVAPANPWAPINKFAGTFDGQGHSIKGLYMKAATDRSGLFAMTTTDATLKNFRIENSYFEFAGPKNAALASVAGELGGTLDSVYSNAIIKGDKLVYGGLAGTIAKGATITNCWFDGQMILGEKGGWAGGIVGSIQGGSKVTIENTLSTGAISSKYKSSPSIGGVCGLITGTKNDVKVLDTLSAGTIQCDATSGVGSLFGYVEKDNTLTFKNTYATTECRNVVVGGNKGTVKGVYRQSALSNLEGIRGYQFTLLDFNNDWSAVEANVPAPKTLVANALPINAEKMINLDWYNEEAYKQKGYYELNTVADLYGFAYLSDENDFAGKTVKLGQDITVNAGTASMDGWVKAETGGTDYKWTPIGKGKAFAGTFDGQGHTISGVYLDTNVKTTGLFAATTADAKLVDFRLENSYFKSTNKELGSIAGNFGGKLNKVYSDAFVIGGDLASVNTGGLIGLVSKETTLDTCWFAGQVSVGTKNSDSAGGLIGACNTGKTGGLTIKHCLNSGDVIGRTFLGGLLGYVTETTGVTIHDSLNTGVITKASGKLAGGFIGYNATQTNITNSYCSNQQDLWGGYYGSMKPIYSNTGKFTVADYLNENGYKLKFLDFDNYWMAKYNSNPILQYFAEGFVKNYTLDKDNKRVYSIQSVEDLYQFALLSRQMNFADCTIKLDVDNLQVNTGYATKSGWTENENPINWVPIGSVEKPFAGTFDGQGNTISGLYLVTTTKASGLFGTTATSATIKDFRIENSYFKTLSTELGSVVGNFGGTMEKVYSDAVVVGGDLASIRVGGLIGLVSKEAIVDTCWFAGDVTVGTTNSDTAGGIVGGANTGNNGSLTIKHCLYTGSVVGRTFLGGIIGDVRSTTSFLIEDCLSTGTLTKASGKMAGGFIGYNVSTTEIKNSYCSNANDFWGGYYGTKPAYSGAGKFTVADYVGENGSKLTYLDFTNYWTVATYPASTPVLKALVKNQADTSWCDDSVYAEKGYYELSDAQDFYGLAKLVNEGNNFLGKTIKLSTDIVVNRGTASETGWTPIKATENKKWVPIGKGNAFAGTFDGQGHTISGIYLDATEQTTGLFAATTTDAKLKDFRIENSYFKSTKTELGSVVGSFGGTMERVYSNAFVAGADLAAVRVGGLIGLVSKEANVDTCWFAGKVSVGTTNSDTAGGIVGGANTGNNGSLTIRHCLYTGSVVGRTFLGGIIGDVRSTTSFLIEDCLSTGTLTKASGKMAGGFIGYNVSATEIKNSYCSNANDFWGGYYGTKPAYSGAGKFTVADYVGAKGLDLKYLDFANYWVAKQNTTPELKALTDVTTDYIP